MSSFARRETKRLSKQGERAKTHALHNHLDVIVPLRGPPEGGKLPSRRTVAQLLEDTVAHVRSERIDEQAREEEEREMDDGVISDKIFVKGMQSSRMHNFIFLRHDSLEIVSLSKGTEQFFQGFTLCPLIGASILFFVHQRDVAAVKKCLQSLQGARETGEMEASFLTFPGHAGISYITFRILIKKVPEPKPGLLFLELQQEELVKVHKPDLTQMVSIELEDWNSFDFDRFAGVFRFDELLSQGSPWDLDEKTSERIGRTTRNPSLWSHMCSRFMRNHQVGALIRRISSEVGLQIARLVKMMVQFHCAVEKDGEGTPFFVSYVRMKLPSYLGAFKLDWHELLRIDLHGTPKKVPGSANLHTATYIHRMARKGTLAFSQFLFYEDGGSWSCYQTKLLELDCDLMQICYSGDHPMIFRNVLVKVEENDPQVFPSIDTMTG